jgi:hypothetical protein
MRLLSVFVALVLVSSSAFSAEKTAEIKHAPSVAQERPLLKRKVLQETVLIDFAAAGAEKSVKAASPDVNVAVENGICRITYPARIEGAGAMVWNGAVDLTKTDVLRFAINNKNDSRVDVVLMVFEADNKQHGVIHLPLDPGNNEFCLPTWFLLRSKEKADAPEEKLDTSKIGSLQIAVKRRADSAVIEVGKISAQKLFAASAQTKFYDFGPGSVALGATPVRDKTLYDTKLGYGLSGTELASRVWQEEFPLFGGTVTGKDLAFRADLLDGEYEVQIVAFGTTWQGARSPSYKIFANDALVVDFQNTAEKFYSFDGQYYGANIFFDPAKTLFDQYHRKYFEAARFETKTNDGVLNLKFEGCGPRALWIYPKANAQEGRELVDCLYAEEGHNLWQKHARVREHPINPTGVAATDADQKRGYGVFCRDYQYRVYPNQLPEKSELLSEDGITISMAPGEYEPLTFVIRPTKDLGLTRISISVPMLGEQKISPVAVDPYFVKYFPQRVSGMWFEPIPTMLYPYSDQQLKKDWNFQYWATLYVPPGTHAGDYRGFVNIEPQHGEKYTIPVTVRVYPFDLPKTKMECGMWNTTSFGIHQLSAFPQTEFTRAMIDAEMRNMSQHNLNCYAFGQPTPKDYDMQNISVKLDFSNYDLFAEATKKYGMNGRHKFTVQNIMQYGFMKRKVLEFSPEFNRAYKQILSEVRDWMKTNNVAGVLQVTDEPRETELNDWNRNRRDTIKYLKLAREVAGLQTMVTLMGDVDAFNRPYTLMIPLMDVCASHCWPRSADQMYLCTVENLADFWAYNNGFLRFPHGFYLWKSKAKGHWQWVYSWEVTDAHIPVFYPRDTSAVFAFPGGFLNTLKYEQCREGIDDHRYISLLQELIAAAPKDDPSIKDAAAFLKALDRFLPQYPHNDDLVTGAEAGGVYDESKSTTYFEPWRAQIAEYISALKLKRAPKKLDAAWAMFPQSVTATQKTVVCKLVAKGPEVGNRNDPLWNDAAEAGDFVNLAQGVGSANVTRVKTVCDGENIYFRFTVIEPKYGELKAYAINRDEACWQDDSIEAFLDVKHNKTTYKHVIVNCLGTIQDSDGRDSLWNGGVKTAVFKDKGMWVADFSVTLESLGADVPKPGTTWGVNLCRNRQPQPPEISSWAHVGTSFHNPSGFGIMEFK